MIGSPNYVRFVYDGDNSAFPVGPGAAKGPQGSGELERVFHDYFTSQGLASDETPFSGRSDYGPFIATGVDIPAGGLFTGAEGLKTAEQARVYGGTAGVAYDACYHLRCDDLKNVNTTGLGEMADAAGHATLTMAKRDFVKNPLINPSTPVTGTGGTTDAGGGLHPPHEHDHEEGDAE
jgi:Zn-dependent M28 family amino/carboxypeptidase